MAFTLGDPVKKFGTSGGHSIRSYNVSPDSASGNVTISDVAEVYVLGVVPLSEAPTATTDNGIILALQNATTLNQVDITLWASSFVAATTFKDFLLTVMCVDA